MKYLVVMGSPRKRGNTNKLALEFKKQVEELGHICDVVNVYDYNIKGCVNCNYCQNNTGCCIKDDVTHIINNIGEYDTLILASPLYFFYFTAQIKAFLDRLYSYPKQNLQLGSIVVSGSEFFDGGSDLAIETLRRSCSYCGMIWVGAVQKTTFDNIEDLNDTDINNIAKLVQNTLEVAPMTSVFISN